MGRETTRKHLTLYQDQIDDADDRNLNLSAFTREAIDEKLEREA